jgi:hypothetical protein
MPRKGHRSKGQLNRRAHQQRLLEDALDELREVIGREQDERRREDEEHYLDQLDEEEQRDERGAHDE